VEEVDEERREKKMNWQKKQKLSIFSLTMTMTTSSTSGNLASYILQSRAGGADILARRDGEKELF